MAKIVFFPERRNKKAKIMKVCGKNMPKYSMIYGKFARLFVSLHRERRDRVELRCAERWHLCDDEQFDLAAWFLSLKNKAGHVWPAFFIS